MTHEEMLAEREKEARTAREAHEREVLRSALTDGYWQRTGYRTSWEHIGPLMDAILSAGFRLVD